MKAGQGTPRADVGGACPRDHAARYYARLWPRLADSRAFIELTFAYWNRGGGRGTVGAAARRADGRHDRAPARMGTARARWFLVGLGVLGSRRRPPARSQ